MACFVKQNISMIYTLLLNDEGLSLPRMMLHGTCLGERKFLNPFSLLLFTLV